MPRFVSRSLSPVATLCAAAALCAPAMSAEVPPGRYVYDDPALCESTEAGAFVELTPDEFRYESGSCALSRPVNVIDMPARLYDGLCTSDSGSEFESRLMFMEGRDGELVVIWPGVAVTYQPCG